jgi:hypothetical protein
MGKTTSDLETIIKILNKTIEYKDSEINAERKVANSIWWKLLTERDVIRDWQYSYDVLETRYLTAKNHNKTLEKTIESLGKGKAKDV